MFVVQATIKGFVNSPVRDEGKVSGKVQLVQRGDNRATDLAAVAKEMGFVVLIPKVMEPQLLHS